MKKADRSKRAAVRSKVPTEAAISNERCGAERSEPARRGVPTSDPAYSVLAGILDVVRTTNWHFARIESNGELRALTGAEDADRSALADEFRRQRLASPVGPRIAATMRPFTGAVSGITLIFADARADYGIITLLRDTKLGSFTSSEISMLTFALDAGSDRLSALRLQPPFEQKEIAPGPRLGAAAPSYHEEAFYVLDRDLGIVLAWSSEEQRRFALTGAHEQMAERLPPMLEETVRELTAPWATSPLKEPGIARPVSFLVVRTQPLSGPSGLFIGVRIDRFLPPNSLTGAAGRFHISPREVQVLALLLDGDHLDQIAAHLHITSSTVQDHIKSMLDKTESRNRSELIARILGWESSPNPRASL